MRLIYIFLILFLKHETNADDEIKCEVKSVRDWIGFQCNDDQKGRTTYCEFDNPIKIAESVRLSNDLDTNVTKINFSRQEKVEYLPQYLNESFPNLVKIDAFNCAIKSLSRTNFRGLQRLSKINLENNQLERIDEDTFELLSLNYIYLDNNKLSTLAPNLFKPLVDLDTLYLNQNQLTSLHPKQFRNNEKIALLHINDNKLKTLPSGIFNGLTKMRQLWLRNNEIEEFPANIFDGLESLVDLDLSKNKIKTIDTNLLVNLRSLREVSFSFNPLNFIDLAIFEKNEALTDLYFNSVNTTDVRNIDRVDQMKNIKGIGLDNGCVDGQFHESNLDKLKTIVKDKCMTPLAV